MINFVALDFETANSKRSSACSIGLAFVEDGKIVRTEHHLIKPRPNYFDSMNIHIHGITPQDVKNAPLFNELWADLESKLSGKMIVAHNASFDMSVLRATLSAYEIEYPELQYTCTYLLAKYLYPELFNYKLPTICAHINFDFSNHHNAEADALAAASVMLKMMEHTNCTELAHIEKAFPICLGQIYKNYSYQSCSINTYTRKTELVSLAQSDPNKEIDTGNPFFGKNVLFTGTLASMTREQAWKVIIDCGGNPLKSFTSKIDFLICAVPSLTDETMNTTKVQKTMELKRKGAQVEILTEQDFLSLTKPESSQYELTIDIIKSHEELFIRRNMYNDFSNTRVLFSDNISNQTNWQLIGDCGGNCCYKEEDIPEANYFVISNEDVLKLEKHMKSPSVIRYEDAVRKQKNMGVLKNITVMSENCFFQYLEKRKMFQLDRSTMNLHPYEITINASHEEIIQYETKYEITPDLINFESDYLLKRKKNAEFSNKRTLFSRDICTLKNWERITDCGGACCYYPTEFPEIDFFVVSNKDIELLKQGTKSETIIQFEAVWNSATKQNDITRALKISENAFEEYLKNRPSFKRSQSQ